MAGIPEEMEAKECSNPNNPGCTNMATPGDHRGMCLNCNPYGDSPVMNNDPEYLAWLFRPETY